MGGKRQAIIILFALLAWSGAAGPAGAAKAKPYVCDDTCINAVYDWLLEDVRYYMPLHFQPSERFDGEEAQEACPVSRTTAPAVHGIVVAPLYPHYLEFQSTQNDAQLISDFLTERGVAPELLTVASGAGQTRPKVLQAMRRALRCVRERDQVVLYMSGNAAAYNRGVAPRFEQLPDYLCIKDHIPEGAEGFCANTQNIALSSYDLLEMRYRQILEDYAEMLFFTSEVKIDDTKWRHDVSMRLVGIGGFEISNFVTQIRNRGADAVVLIDTSYAAGFNVQAMQRESSKGAEWMWNTAWTEEPPETALDENLVGLYGQGQFAAFYSSTNDQVSGEVKVSDDAQPVGYLALAFTEALRADPSLSIVALSKVITETMHNDNAVQQPIFAASSKTMKLLAPEPAVDSAEAGAIEIIAPSPKRGAAGIEERSFTLVARYAGAGEAARAIVDGELVPVDRNGQFRRDISDTGGKYTIPIRVLSADFRTLATAELTLRAKEDEPVIAAAARKVALIIANQSYEGSDAFPALKTPLADAEAVAEVLRKRYGFTTGIGEGAKALDLFLKDASKAQIQQVLYELRQRLTPEDQLIVYYAGHGESDPDLGAFWVPVDGQPKADFTWIAAEEITRELKRMNAGAVLVISDSCYAGGLSRGGAEEDVPDAARERYLAKASRLKARQLIASGGDEPVEDGGGGGHSVFARALIAALTSMPEKTFTASELFEQKVKPAVISAASATSEGQTPGFSRIARAGDEPGSEFVFQAAQASP